MQCARLCRYNWLTWKCCTAKLCMGCSNTMQRQLVCRPRLLVRSTSWGSCTRRARTCRPNWRSSTRTQLPRKPKQTPNCSRCALKCCKAPRRCTVIYNACMRKSSTSWSSRRPRWRPWVRSETQHSARSTLCRMRSMQLTHSRPLHCGRMIKPVLI